MTIFTPDAATFETMSSTAFVAAGSRLAVGSSRNRISGSRASARAKREPLLLAAGEAPCRAVGKVREADLREQLAHARRIVPVERIGDIRRRAPAQHHGPLEHHREAFVGLLAPPPGHAAGGRRYQVHRKAQQRAFARPVRAEQDRRRTGKDFEAEIVDDVDAADAQRDAFEGERQIA